MVSETEGTFVIEGKSLYTKAWLPDSTPRAKLIHIHGFSDHIGRYNQFFRTLADRGIAVYGFDQRGWGRSVASPADRGLTGPTARVIADMAAFIEPHLPGSPADPPVFVLGHSMGGGQVLTLACDPAYAQRITARVRGWLLEAPLIALAPEEVPSALKVLAGRLAGRLLPRFQMKHVMPPEDLCSAPEVVSSLRDDALVHNTGTLEGLAGLLDRTDPLHRCKLKAGPEVRALWLGHGTADKATHHEGSRRWFDQCAEAVQDKTFRSYEGWYHQLHEEPEKEIFYNDVAEWVLERARPEGGTEARPEAKL